MENRPIIPQPSEPTQTPPPLLVETVGGQPRTNLVGGIIAGVVAAIVAAAIWAVILSMSGWQIGFLAIGVGFVVGAAVRFGAKGTNMVLGAIAAVLALGSIVLGDVFAIAANISNVRNVSIPEILLTPAEFSFVTTIFSRNFEIITLLFYGLAVYAAFNAAAREGVRGVRS